MLRDIKVTLYDIFGYLLPGAVFLAAIAVLFWVIYIPQTPLVFVQLTIETWVLILLLAYFSGHIVQALGNLLIEPFFSTKSLAFSKSRADSLPDALVQSAKSKASAMLGVDLKDISPEWLYRICDETVVQCGAIGDREVYQYREGFYRGLTVSFLMLFLSLVVRTAVPGTSLKLSDTLQAINGLVLLFFILISLAGSLLAFLRYRRFARYRVIQAIIGFLALQGSKGSKNFQDGKEEA